MTMRSCSMRSWSLPACASASKTWPGHRAGRSDAAALRGCTGRRFLLTADDHEALISRPKSFSDDAYRPAMPLRHARCCASATCSASRAILLPRAYPARRLAGHAQVSGRPCLDAAGTRAISRCAADCDRARCRGGDPALAARTQCSIRPRRWTLAIPADAAGLPPALATKPAADMPIAYLCRGTQCSAPIRSLSALLAELDHHDPQARAP